LALTLSSLLGWAGSLAAVPQPQAAITNSIGMKLVLIPAGKFTMGSPLSEPEREQEEVPHEVVITQPFYMGAFEVTQREFARVKGNKPRAEFDSDRGGGPEHPMETLLWKDAADFCEQLSKLPEEQRAGRQYRLPSEAEWEYACRAGASTPFSFGDSLASVQANFNGAFPYGSAPPGPYLRKTAKVGSYKPNAFGLYDMHGNAWEWCADWYDANYYRNSPREDPLGPPTGVLPTDYGDFYVVVRGGSWLDDARGCRSAYRYRAMPENGYRLIGFRVVCDVAI
jgi:formylglycine-generating enzyme required for sulfatase activity